MAAVTARSRVVVRAAIPGEGKRVAALWRELWDVHESWGGYAATRDDRVYARLATRLDEDARVRHGHPVLGRHVHLVAAVNGEIAGQVEGWFERHGGDASTPYTCEVRSLIVAERARGLGVGRALLEVLASYAHELARRTPAVLAAEVLEPNPAHDFYARVGYRPVAYSARISSSAPPVHAPGARGVGLSARTPEARDALPIAVLESMLAGRRRAAGDRRFDPPRSIDATFIGAIAAHLDRRYKDPSEPLDLVVEDEEGEVRGSASLLIAPLDPPFAPSKRGVLGRFALDPARDPFPLAAALIGLACRIARSRDTPTVELTDLPPPGSPLYEAAIRAGGRPWSRIVTRLATEERSQ